MHMDIDDANMNNGIEFSFKLSKQSMPLKHAWEHTIGSGHATLALRADWQQQLRRCHQELGMRHVRFHGLLSDDMGTLICQSDKLIYSFFNTDKIMDFLVSSGMRPFVELSFMPATLSSGEQTVFHYRANVTPPRDYQRWATLIEKLVAHWVARYGLSEVRQWFFEVWNEPNLNAFWTGKQEDYFELYRHTVEAIKRIDSSLQVGGPATAQNAWVPEFVSFCERNNLPADFISTHYYPTDAFGSEETDTISQLADAPHHVMRQRASETHEHAKGRPVYYTEWSISSNPRDPFHDEPFAAALVTNILMSVDSLVAGYSYWTFTDVFEENYFPSVPFHGGFGLLNLYGIAKPAYRAFELLHRLGDELLVVEGSHKTVSAWTVRNKDGLTVLLTNHAMPRHAINTELARVTLSDASEPRSAYVERIDDDHANARRVWIDIGEPEYLSESEVDQLRTASSLQSEPQPLSFKDQTIQFDIALPPHSVAAITIAL